MPSSQWTSPAPSGGTPPPEITVARALQRLAARNLGRAFVPLGMLAVGGVVKGIVQGFSGTGAGLLILGALASSMIMLAYGVQSVRRVLGRPPGAWAPLFWVASFVPYAYGLYVLFGLGLAPFSRAGLSLPAVELVFAVVFSVLGVLCLRAQWKLSEVHRLSMEMSGLQGMTGSGRGPVGP